MGAPDLRKIHNDDFKRGFGISAAMHAIIIAFFGIKFAFFTEPVLDLSQAVRVDMVGLPDKAEEAKLPPKVEEILKEKLPDKEEPKPAVEEKKEVIKEPTKPKLPDKTEKVDKEAVDLKKSKQKQKAALDKLKKLEAIEKIKQDIKNEAQQAKTQSRPLKGRIITPGSALTGLDKLDANTYLQGLDYHVKQNWSLPQWLMNKTLKAQVHVRFDTTGKILSRVILKSSGEPAYDEQCLEAVDRSAPFPAVPEKFSEKFKVDGVVIGFPE